MMCDFRNQYGMVLVRLWYDASMHLLESVVVCTY